MFLLAPIVYLLTGIAPVSAYSFDFFKHAVPFLAVNELALIVGLWGIAPTTGRAMYLAFFPIAMRAFWIVLRGEKIKFPVTPKDRQDGRFLHLVRPQLALIVLSLLALAYGAGAHPHERRAAVARPGHQRVLADERPDRARTIVRAAMWQPRE